MATLKLNLVEIVDRFVRENFKKLDDYLRSDVFRKGSFQFYEFEVASDTAHAYPAVVAVRHNLGVEPKDVIVTSVSPDTVTATVKYDSFTRTKLSFRVSAACTIRAYVGRYGEN